MKFLKLFLILLFAFTIIACDVDKNNNNTTIGNGGGSGGGTNDGTGGDGSDNDREENPDTNDLFGMSDILIMSDYEYEDGTNNTTYFLHKSTDNGLSWSLVESSKGNSIFVSMLNEKTYIITSFSEALYRSTDNLSTLKKLDLNIPNSYFVANSFFRDRLHLTVKKDNMTLIYHSDDAGDTFTKTFEETFDSCNILRPSFIDETVSISSKLISACYRYDTTINNYLYSYYKSEDKGKTWHKMDAGLGRTDTMNYIALSDDILFLNTKDGIYRSVDGWNNFTKLRFDLTAAKSYGIYSGNNNVIFVSVFTEDNKATIYRSDDLGMTFEPVFNQKSENITIVAPPAIINQWYLVADNRYMQYMTMTTSFIKMMMLKHDVISYINHKIMD